MTKFKKLFDFYNDRERVDQLGTHKIYNDLTGTSSEYNSRLNYAEILKDFVLRGEDNNGNPINVNNTLPPEGIHWVGRKSGVFFDFQSVNEIVSILDKSKISLKKGGTYLDFGCSSGRTVKSMKLYNSDVNFVGCDPDESTIKWAAEHIKDCKFFASPQLPELEVKGSSYEGVYSISVFSHLREEEAIMWFDELHRVVKTGGFLYFTAPSFYRLRNKLRATDVDNTKPIDKKADELLNNGHYFRPSFKRSGNRDLDTIFWGEAGLTVEWIVKHLLNKWSLSYRIVGGNRGQQDTYVLVKK